MSFSKEYVSVPIVSGTYRSEEKVKQGAGVKWQFEWSLQPILKLPHVHLSKFLYKMTWWMTQ
jgi:hypothetical protein